MIDAMSQLLNPNRGRGETKKTGHFDTKRMQKCFTCLSKSKSLRNGNDCWKNQEWCNLTHFVRLIHK